MSGDLGDVDLRLNILFTHCDRYEATTALIPVEDKGDAVGLRLKDGASGRTVATRLHPDAARSLATDLLMMARAAEQGGRL